MTAVGEQRQAERNQRYALLLVEAKLLGLQLDETWKKQHATAYNMRYLANIIARKRAQK